MARIMIGSDQHDGPETARALLHSIARAQVAFQQSGALDRNRDAVGEFGSLAELLAVGPLLDGPAFGDLDVQGRVRVGDYLAVVMLPDREGRGHQDAPFGGRDVAVDPLASGNWWAAYAWPADGEAGDQAFFVSHRGELFATRMDVTVYASGRSPRWDAALDGSRGDLSDLPASGIRGSDGNRWSRLR